MQETKLTGSKCCLILPYALVVPLQINSVHKLSKDKIAPGGVMSQVWMDAEQRRGSAGMMHLTKLYIRIHSISIMVHFDNQQSNHLPERR